MLVTPVVHFQLKVGQDTITLTQHEAIALSIWLRLLIHYPMLIMRGRMDLELDEMRCWVDDDQIRIGDCQGGISLIEFRQLRVDIEQLLTTYSLPSFNEHTFAALGLKTHNNVIGYFDRNNCALLPVGLRVSEDKSYVMVVGKPFNGRYAFGEVTESIQATQE